MPAYALILGALAGESFISSDGWRWDDISAQEVNFCAVCLPEPAELGCPVVGDKTYGDAARDRRLRVTFAAEPPSDIVYAG